MGWFSALEAIASLLNKLAGIFQYERAHQAGVEHEQNAELKQINSEQSQATSIAVEIGSMSDADVSARLRQFQRD